MRFKLSWQIPGLLVDGSPVVEAGVSGMTGAQGVIYTKEGAPTDYYVLWTTVCPGMGTSITGGTVLDYTKPLGVMTAWAWLKAKGHDLRAYLEVPETLAQAVLRVHEGQQPLAEMSCYTCKWAAGTLCGHPDDGNLDLAIEQYTSDSGCMRTGMPEDRSIVCPGWGPAPK